MKVVLVILMTLISSCAYAMTTEQICQRIGNLATYCKDIPPKIEDMKTELEYLQIQHQLEQARKGVFSEPTQIQLIAPKQQDVIVTTTITEE